MPQIVDAPSVEQSSQPSGKFSVEVRRIDIDEPLVAGLVEEDVAVGMVDVIHRRPL